MASESPQAAPASNTARATLRQAWKAEVKPALAIILATLAVELGVLMLGGFAGLQPRGSAVAMLMAAVVWTAVAAPALAASGRSTLSGLLRGGLVADTTLASLLVMWAFWNSKAQGLGAMSLLSVLEVYCTYAALAIFAVLAVRSARSEANRYILAAIVSTLLMLALATPLWSGGLIAATEGATRQAITAMAVWTNPLYSITSAIIDPLRYVVHQEGLMYQLTLIGDYAAPPICPWWMATAVYLSLGVVVTAINSFPTFHAKAEVEVPPRE